VRIDEHVSDSSSFAIVKTYLKQRYALNGQQAFGNPVSEWAQTSAVSSGQEKSLHEIRVNEVVLKLELTPYLCGHD
jgi:hypothetical protein